MEQSINLTLKVWRQKDKNAKGGFELCKAENIDTAMSFLEMLDVVNEKLAKEGKDPIAFDHDCREGICGMCGAVVNGRPHGPRAATTLCQLHMRHFRNNDTITIEPWRAKAFPVIKDLAVDRSAFDRILAAGGYISVKTGCAPDANSIIVSRDNAELSMDAAACIGCGACVAGCPNASAMLYVGGKISQFSLLPQGQIEAKRRAVNMVKKMDGEGFGACSNEYECQAVCPKKLNITNIARMNRDFLRGTVD